jgi:hypothetical protein
MAGYDMHRTGGNIAYIVAVSRTFFMEEQSFGIK